MLIFLIKTSDNKYDLGFMKALQVKFNSGEKKNRIHIYNVYSEPLSVIIYIME